MQDKCCLDCGRLTVVNNRGLCFECQMEQDYLDTEYPGVFGCIFCGKPKAHNLDFCDECDKAAMVL